MKTKYIAFFALLTIFGSCFISSQAEARSHFSINIGGLFAAPQPVVYERHFVEYAGPVYVQPAPVYVEPAPVVVMPSPRYYIAPRSYYRPVYVQPRPYVSTGFSFSFFK